MLILNKIGLAFKLARWHYFPVSVLPVVLGTAIVWNQGLHIYWLNFVLCFFGIFFVHLAANAANDLFDEKSGVDLIVYETLPEARGSGVGGSGVLQEGKLSIKEARGVVAIFFMLAGLAAIILTITSGWFVLVMALIGLIIGLFYCAPPIAFGYIGYGLGEAGIFLAFGPLTVLGSYFVQTGNLSWTPVVASLPLAFFTTSIVFNQHFAHVEADRVGEKRTPIVIWGEAKMRVVSKILLMAAYTSILIGVLFQFFPKYSLVALITAPIILLPAFRLPMPASNAESIKFLFKVVQVNILTAVILIISYII